ncbi:MAG: hypothetical protein AB2A00_25360 [Myxococcota bacterium]
MSQPADRPASSEQARWRVLPGPRAVAVIDDELVYRHGDTGWSMPLADIRVMGEATREALGDDYFLCVVTDGIGWQEVSFYAHGVDTALAGLSRHLGATLRWQLIHHTSLSSRVMWPAALVDQELLTVLPARSWWGRLLQRLGVPPVSSDVQLSPTVLGHLQQR